MGKPTFQIPPRPKKPPQISRPYRAHKSTVAATTHSSSRAAAARTSTACRGTSAEFPGSQHPLNRPFRIPKKATHPLPLLRHQHHFHDDDRRKENKKAPRDAKGDGGEKATIPVSEPPSKGRFALQHLLRPICNTSYSLRNHPCTPRNIPRARSAPMTGSAHAGGWKDASDFIKASQQEVVDALGALTTPGDVRGEGRVERGGGGSQSGEASSTSSSSMSGCKLSQSRLRVQLTTSPPSPSQARMVPLFKTNPNTNTDTKSKSKNETRAPTKAKLPTKTIRREERLFTAACHTFRQARKVFAQAQYRWDLVRKRGCRGDSELGGVGEVGVDDEGSFDGSWENLTAAAADTDSAGEKLPEVSEYFLDVPVAQHGSKNPDGMNSSSPSPSLNPTFLFGGCKNFTKSQLEIATTTAAASQPPLSTLRTQTPQVSSQQRLSQTPTATPLSQYAQYGDTTYKSFAISTISTLPLSQLGPRRASNAISSHIRSPIAGVGNKKKEEKKKKTCVSVRSSSQQRLLAQVFGRKVGVMSPGAIFRIGSLEMMGQEEKGSGQSDGRGNEGVFHKEFPC